MPFPDDVKRSDQNPLFVIHLKQTGKKYTPAENRGKQNVPVPDAHINPVNQFLVRQPLPDRQQVTDNAGLPFSFRNVNARSS